jgi:hypothetical protein
MKKRQAIIMSTNVRLPFQNPFMKRHIPSAISNKRSMYGCGYLQRYIGCLLDNDLGVIPTGFTIFGIAIDDTFQDPFLIGLIPLGPGGFAYVFRSAVLALHDSHDHMLQ